MIEPIMYFGIGFLAASLIALPLIRLVHDRAARLTAKRIEAAIPFSMAEIKAEKDQLRAEFAMSTRRLEMSIDQLKARTTSQLAELGKKNDAINRLKGDLTAKTAAIVALEAREASLRAETRSLEEDRSAKTNALNEATRALADKEAELARLAADLGERSLLADSQRVEILALRTQVEALKSQVDRLDGEAKDAASRIERERREAAAAARQLGEERRKAETVGARAQNLDARLAEQGQILAEREAGIERLRAEIDRAHGAEAGLRVQIAALEDGHKIALASLRGELAQAQRDLERLREERSTWQHDIDAFKREAGRRTAAEHTENELLRERIEDVAAEIARLTMVLEGPGSSIEALLASEGRAAHHGNGKRAPGARASRRRNLADRIRALQARAARASSAR